MIHNYGHSLFFITEAGDNSMISWAYSEMQGASLWDGRCVRSMARICERRLDLPRVSFSRACGEDGRQAAHRIFSHHKTTISGLLAGHFERTRARCHEQATASVPKRLLIVQDTTSFKYTTHTGTTGLGPIHQSLQGQGLIAHAALALPQSGPPLGLVHLSIWARGSQDHGQRRDREPRACASIAE